MEKNLALEKERERLKELYAYSILDTKEEKDFNDLALLAAQICGTPISSISLVDKSRVWFKAITGLDATEAPRNITVCSHTIEQSGVMVINDLTKDERFKNNPFVTENPFLRFYAGVPLVSTHGFSLGALCVVDKSPRDLTVHQLSALKIIATQVMTQMNLRLHIRNLQNIKRRVSESEMRFKSLAQNAPIGIFQTDATGKGIYVNEKWCEIVSISPNQAYDSGWVESVYQEDRQKFLAIWARCFSVKGDFNLNFRFQNQVTGLRWVKSHASPLFDDHGEFTGYVGTLEDITQQKIAESRLEESEKLFQLISSNSKDLLTIFEANDEAKCVYVSPSCREILGYEPEELIGLSPFEMMPPEQAKVLKEHYLVQILNGQSTRTENQLRKSDGNLIWVEALSKPIYNADGKILTFQSSVREITERKKIEEQLKNEKIKAEDSARAKSIFLSTMSHEIRTPMNAVIGLTNLLLAENPRTDQLQSLSLLRFSSENLLALINDILDYNKIEAGKIELENIQFNIGNTIQKYVDLSKDRASNKGIQVILKLDEKMPQVVFGDPVRFGQVLNNLIGNAIKFTDRGSVSVISELRKMTDNTCQVRFTIRDTGIGIAESKVDMIFENFSQGGNDIARKYGGTGLGLSISKKLIQLMGGEIKVSSVPEIGTDFYFDIDFKVGNIESKKETPPVINNSIHQLNVLVAEDNMVNQVVVGSFLKKWGMKVTFAANGIEALDKIKDKSFDIVLMDLQMPEMDGIEATLQIRQKDDPYFKRIPILALTASVLPEIKAQANNSGFTDFITKPFQAPDLKARILQYTTAEIRPPDSTSSEKKMNGNLNAAA